MCLEIECADDFLSCVMESLSFDLLLLMQKSGLHDVIDFTFHKGNPLSSIKASARVLYKSRLLFVFHMC